MKHRAPQFVYSLFGIAAMSALIFFSSGRLDYWQGWVFFGVNLAVVGLTAWVFRDDLGLVSERLNPGKGTKWWDKGYFLLSTPLYFTAAIVAGVDAGRRHWSHQPTAVIYVLVLGVYLVGQALFMWAKRVNPFFSSVARIQSERGQSVCREGPYRFCRHPGYLGGLLFGIATPIVLGSFWGLIPQALAACLLVGRTYLEDRMLTRDLLWYAEYKQAVRFRLVPGIW